MKYIELFAGCGGLSLGLESISAKLMFANELSPMAAETYAFNFFGEDLTQPRNADSRVKWLSSLFSEYEFQRRLRENPYHYPTSTTH
jgi:DNA (cytosine-5)-methyltransferase 1